MKKEDKSLLIDQFVETLKTYPHFYLVDVTGLDSGTTSERYKKKGIIRLGKKPVRPVCFMAVNDILSSPKRFLIMLFTFFVGISMLMVRAWALARRLERRLPTATRRSWWGSFRARWAEAR